MISILILTRNEEQNIEQCLRSVDWSDDIHVYDSFSEDRTIELAKHAGANVIQRHFDDWSTHQNWGLANIAFRHSWVLYVDADERVTPELARNASAAVRQPGNNVAFEIQRRDFLEGRWLRHVQASPFYLRLFRPEKMKYERLVNPISVPDGSVARLPGYLDHFPFSKGIGHWLERHNAYSTLEARQLTNEHDAGVTPSLARALFGRTFHERRVHQKLLFYRMRGRPLLKFCYLYMFKRGFLDGEGGFTYALLQSFYEYMIVLKSRELQLRTLRSPAIGTEASTDGLGVVAE